MTEKEKQQAGMLYDANHDPEVLADLTRWAKQGVLLLNATLTVRAHQAASHQRHGWETFTDAAIRALSAGREHLVFILWGGYARSKARALRDAGDTGNKPAHPGGAQGFGKRLGRAGDHHAVFARALAHAHTLLSGSFPVEYNYILL